MSAGSAEQSALLSPDLSMSAQGASNQVDVQREVTNSAQDTSSQVGSPRECTGRAEQSSAEIYHKIETGDAALNHKLNILEKNGTKATFLIEHDSQNKRAAKDRIVVLKKMKVSKVGSNSGEGMRRQDTVDVIGEEGAVTSGSNLSTQRQVSDNTVEAGQADGEQGEHDSSEQDV